MPELDGLEATRRILAADSSARILILTTFGLDEYVYEALRAGASGFVLDDRRTTDRRGPRRRSRRRPPVTGNHETCDQTIRARAATPAAKEFDELTAREQETLRLIADGLSNAEIGQQLCISETTVKTHVTHILQKLGLHDRVQAIVLAHRPAS